MEKNLGVLVSSQDMSQQCAHKTKEANGILAWISSDMGSRIRKVILPATLSTGEATP